MADMENTFDKVKGNAKEGLGKATGNEKLEAEGRTESTAAGAKEAAQKAGDTLKGAAEGLKNAVKGD